MVTGSSNLGIQIQDGHLGFRPHPRGLPRGGDTPLSCPAGRGLEEEEEGVAAYEGLEGPRPARGWWLQAAAPWPGAHVGAELVSPPRPQRWPCSPFSGGCVWLGLKKQDKTQHRAWPRPAVLCWNTSPNRDREGQDPGGQGAPGRILSVRALTAQAQHSVFPLAGCVTLGE